MAKGDEEQADNESVFEGEPWKAPEDLRVVKRGDTTLLIAKVELPGGKKGARRFAYLTYAMDKEDTKKFDLSKARHQDLTDQEFKDHYPKNQRIDAGNALELTGIEEGQTVEQWFDDTWRRFVGYNPVLETNEEMAFIYAESMLEGWGPAEIKNAVSQTKWWQNRSSEQRQFLLMSPAQQRIQEQETAARLSSTYTDLTGWPIDSDNAYIKRMSRNVASGKVSYDQAQLNIQARAAKDPNTPWATRLREMQRRRGISIEENVTKLRQTSAEWGVKMGDDHLNRWAQRLNDLERSEEDFLEFARDRAEEQWGSLEAGTSNRRRDTSVDEWASPYMQSYTSLMEKGTATSTDVLFDNQFRSFLDDPSVSVGDFETKIKKSDAWRNTNNGKAASNELLARVGQLMGYS